MDQLKDSAERAIRVAMEKGSTTADVMIREESTFSLSVRKGNLETLKEALSRALSLRVFVGNRTATSHTSDLSESTMERIIEQTVEMARLTSEDEHAGLPDPDVFTDRFPDLDLFDEEWESLDTPARIEMARVSETVALDVDPLLTNSGGAFFDYTRARTVIANSEGFAGGYRSTSAAFGVAPIAESDQGRHRDHWMSVSRHRKDLEDPETVGRKAAERTLRRVGARKPATCEVPVVFDPWTARSLIGHVFRAVSGDSIYRQASFLVDHLGEVIAAPDVCIVDDALMPRGLGSVPFDDEGVPGHKLPIVEAGVLKNYLHTSYTARKLGGVPTGNGTRALSGVITTGPNNFYLQPGPYTPEEIIESVESGLYVVELIGTGVNPVTGDYSRGAVGMWIENGCLAYPVHEVTIAGNLDGMLKDIQMIGNDLTFLESVASPTLKLGNMVVSGE